MFSSTYASSCACPRLASIRNVTKTVETWYKIEQNFKYHCIFKSEFPIIDLLFKDTLPNIMEYTNARNTKYCSTINDQLNTVLQRTIKQCNGKNNLVVGQSACFKKTLLILSEI